MQVLKNVIVVIFLLISVSCSAAPADSDFQLYWSKFRTASLSNDYATLATLTKLPLEVKGVDDSVPIKKYEQTKLNTIFPKLLSQPVFQYQGSDVIETTLRAILEKKEKADFKPSDKNIRIEQFEFEFVDGKWLLIRAYLEE